ncbi:MAG: glycosyl transferase [Chloroflexaceae bacterium]|nr:glycosyl transferase [Chloroflexaceae bacterium]
MTVACSVAFAAQVQAQEIHFYELNITRNANTGIAQRTDQSRSEAERLNAFFEATRHGPIATLRLQSEHRQHDMLTDPERMLADVGQMIQALQPDICIVDQLSYAVTLALYCLQQPFLTYCPGHPTYVPSGTQLFGVPYAWPREFTIAPEELSDLRTLAQQVDTKFTSLFNSIIAAHAPHLPPVVSAFRLCSPLAVLYTYPAFPHLLEQIESNGIERIFMGACFQPETLPTTWRDRLLAVAASGPRILVALGTFLSARTDVLERCICAIGDAYPQALCIVAAGGSAEALAHLSSDRVIIEAFIPQKGLLPSMDVVIHHGGNNSFTESLYYGKPAVILPFSSDQFSIAHDAQRCGLAACLDPNSFTAADLAAAIATLLRDAARADLHTWQAHVQERGPSYAVRQIQAGAALPLT